MESQELIEADGLKQGLLPHLFCGVTTDQHGQCVDTDKTSRLYLAYEQLEFQEALAKVVSII